jgi:hypothetical protein
MYWDNNVKASYRDILRKQEKTHPIINDIGERKQKRRGIDFITWIFQTYLK